MQETRTTYPIVGWRWMLVATICGLACGPARGGDWPQYRGPNHDGVSTETIRTNWTEQSPKVLWKVPLQPALSSFAVAGGRVFTQERRNIGGEDREFCVALDANTGRELWTNDLGVADYPDGGVGRDDGPRSTPSVDGDRVFVFTSYLRLVCLDANKGTNIWSRDLVAEYGANVIPYQNAASPLVVGDLVLVNANAPNRRLMALRKHNGTNVWEAHDDRMTQATPVAATIAGRHQVVFYAQSGLVSVNADSGEALWRFPVRYSTSTAASPVVAGDVVYCSAAYGVGGGAARIAPAGQSLVAAELWRTRGANMNHWATPVHHEGFLYGIYGQSLVSLRCIELATGTEKWRQSGVGTGGVLKVGGLVLVSTEDGQLILVRPDPEKYSEVDRVQAVNGKSWNVPAISNGRIYVRSTTQAACLDISAALAPLPSLKLQAGIPSSGLAFQFEVAAEDGTPLDESLAGRVEVYTSTNLAADPSNWTKFTGATVLENGRLRVTDAAGPTTEKRFFRVQERR